MKRMIRLTPLLLATMLLLGCGSSPIEKAYATRATFNQVVSSVNTARTTQQLDGPTFDLLNDTYHDISDLLDQLDIAAIRAENEKIPLWRAYDFNVLFDKVTAKLNELAVKYATAKQKK